METETEKTETETPTEESNWLKQEAEEIEKNSFDGEQKPALKLEENKIVNMTIDFSEPFKKWVDSEDGTIKKIVPVKVGEVELVWWLNVKNPIYADIIKKGAEGQNQFKVLQTGSKQTTRYTLVED